MLKRIKIIFLALIFIFTYTCTVHYTQNAYAMDDESFYGDGCSASWSDISEYLSVIYKNTPYINVSNGYETRAFYFNVELYMDLGLYVYGEPSCVQFTGSVNDFKAVDYGYFRSGSEAGSLRGEYRYLGYSINGVPITNSRFPSEMYVSKSKMILMKYTDLPNSLKELYSVKDLDNSSFLPIRELIEGTASPIWDFININNGSEVTLRERLSSFGLIKGNLPLINILDYGILYNWAESGGVIRIFYYPEDDPESIRYATFSGPVSVEFTKKLPELTATLSLPYQDGWIEHNTLYYNGNKDSVPVMLYISSDMIDNYHYLTNFEKRFAYTRENVIEYDLKIKGLPVNNISLNKSEKSVTSSGYLTNYSIPVSWLSPGRNSFFISGTASVRFSNYTLFKTANISFNIMYNPPGSEPETTNNPTTSPSPGNLPGINTAPAPTPTHDAAPTPLPTETPVPRIAVKRKW